MIGRKVGTAAFDPSCQLLRSNRLNPGLRQNSVLEFVARFGLSYSLYNITPFVRIMSQIRNEMNVLKVV